MPQTYDKLGVHFLYPDNWQLTDEQASESPYAVTLQTPQGGLWVLQVHLEGDPMELAAEGLKTMREEYPELEADSIVDQVEGLDVVGFEMRFYYLDFVAMATIVSFRRGDQTLVVLCQAEDRDFTQLEPIFRAILVSLARGRK
ncbi:MAG: hypothetical protein U1A77_22650 [Pirellulales bacterium]